MSYLDPAAKAFWSVIAANAVIQPIVFLVVPNGPPIVSAIVVFLDILVVIFSFATLVDGVVEERDQANAKIDAKKRDEKQALEERNRRAREAYYAREVALDAEYAARRAAEARRQEIDSLQAAINAVRAKRKGGA